MTLITQFKNKNLSFVAGYGLVKSTCFKLATNKEIVSYDNNFNKVYKCFNMLIGTFGDVDPELIKWLNETYKEYNAEDVDDKLCEFFKLIKKKHFKDAQIINCPTLGVASRYVLPNRHLAELSIIKKAGGLVKLNVAGRYA
jgi:hypothetical protein